MGVFATANFSPSDILSKSTDNPKSMMSLREGAADDREEGEIIDEYEDIISSDEEFSMRQRIEELEAKNAELEKIANISAIYASGNYDYSKKDLPAHHVDRYPLISIDISDEEDYPPTPSMTRIGKCRKSAQHSTSSRRKMLHTSGAGSHRRRKKSSSSPPPPPPYRPADKLLLSMFHEKCAARTSLKMRRKSKKSHSNKEPRKMRDCQYINDDYTFDTYNLGVEDGYENYNSSDEEERFSINRDELRLALARNTHHHEQHVSLKDRLIRRRENTNTLNEKNGDDAHEVVEVEDVSDGPPEKAESEDNMEEQELRIIALKSAVIRKHLVRKKRNENAAYSPSDFDQAYANISVSPSINIDDAEPCMEISPVPSPKLVVSDDDGIDTKPVDMDIANSDSECELSYEKWVPIEQIPLPNNVVTQSGLYVPTPMRYGNNVEHQHFVPPDVGVETKLDSPVHLESDVEEEELALRALLLAKMNSPKVNKNVVEQRPKLEERYSPDADTSLEAEALRNFLINNMKKKTQPQNSSASVLKEAVRRLTARNLNNPMERFAESKCQKVSAFSMTLRDAENQLNRSTADLAKIQIGQGGIKPNSTAQRWALWDTDEGYSDVKFHLNLEEIKLKKNFPSGSDGERKCEEINLQPEEQVESFLTTEADEKELGSSLHSESKCLVIKSEKSENRDEEKYDKEPHNLLHINSPVDGGIQEGEEDKKEPSGVLSNCAERFHEAEKHEKELSTIVLVSGSKKVIESDTQVSETIEPISVLEAQGVLKAGTLSQSRSLDNKKSDNPVELAVDHAKKTIPEEEASNLNQKTTKSSTVIEAINEPKESLTQKGTNGDLNRQEKSVELATKVNTATDKGNLANTIVHKTEKCLDISQQINVQTADPSSVSCTTTKSEGDGKQLSQNKSTISKSKKIPSANASNDVKTAIPTNLVKVPVKKVVASGTESQKLLPIDPAKGGKENTALTNPPAAKFPSKSGISSTEKPVITKPQIQRTQKSQPKLIGLQSTKIVKPNKVINTRATDLKRPLTENLAKSTVPSKVAKLDETSNRLITSAEIPQVKNLVIQLRASDSESDYSALSADGEDGHDDLEASGKDFLNRSITIGNEYYDIASPISLPMESPCDTPTRIASPITSVTPQPNVEKSIVNDFFEAQLDKFLKNVRSQVAETSKKSVGKEDPAPAQSTVSTPVAVRHLPEASQQEYRRLINRMKMLERQKQAKNLHVIVRNTPAIASPETKTVGEGERLVRKVLVKNASVSTAKPTCQVKIPTRPPMQKQKSPENGEVDKSNIADTQKTEETCQKTKMTQNVGNSIIVLPKNVQPGLQTAQSLPTSTTPKNASTVLKSTPESSSPKQSNQNLLVLYEKTYRETGNSIISNLDRSIEMVMVAKKAKMEKLKHEHRLMELRKEMDEVQRHIRQQQERITKIYPEICTSHRMIETLKTRRAKIHKDVTAFGKRIVGQNYSMNNDQKQIISEKSKKLAAEIKFVNNMKLHDIEKWQPPTRPTPPLNAAAAETPAVQISITDNDSLACPAHDIVPVNNNKTNTDSETFLSEATSLIEPELTHTIVPEKMLNEPKMGENQTEQDQTNSTNGHEEALENEDPVDDDKQAHKSKDGVEEEKIAESVDLKNDDIRKEDSEVRENEHMGGTKLQDYVSPLGHLRDERQINPNGIVCPYQLMGQCGDKDCKYMHLEN